MRKPDKTSFGIALRFTERFQKEYPGYSHSLVMMDDLRLEIDEHAQTSVNDVIDKVLSVIQENKAFGLVDYGFVAEEIKKLRR